MLASSPEIEAVSETAPDANCFRDFAARPILLFDCAVAIEQFLAQEPDFLYSHYLRQHVPNHPNLT